MIGCKSEGIILRNERGLSVAIRITFLNRFRQGGVYILNLFNLMATFIIRISSIISALSLWQINGSRFMKEKDSSSPG